MTHGWHPVSYKWCFLCVFCSITTGDRCVCLKRGHIHCKKMGGRLNCTGYSCITPKNCNFMKFSVFLKHGQNWSNYRKRSLIYKKNRGKFSFTGKKMYWTEYFLQLRCRFLREFFYSVYLREIIIKRLYQNGTVRWSFFFMYSLSIFQIQFCTINPLSQSHYWTVTHKLA